MKSHLLVAILMLGGATTAVAQQAMVQPKFFDNWSVGLQGGVSTPIKGSPFFKSMRGVAGIDVRKQITPAFGIGAE